MKKYRQRRRQVSALAGKKMENERLRERKPSNKKLLSGLLAVFCVVEAVAAVFITRTRDGAIRSGAIRDSTDHTAVCC